MRGSTASMGSFGARDARAFTQKLRELLDSGVEGFAIVSALHSYAIRLLHIHSMLDAGMQPKDIAAKLGVNPSLAFPLTTDGDRPNIWHIKLLLLILLSFSCISTLVFELSTNFIPLFRNIRLFSVLLYNSFQVFFSSSNCSFATGFSACKNPFLFPPLSTRYRSYISSLYAAFISSLCSCGTPVPLTPSLEFRNNRIISSSQKILFPIIKFALLNIGSAFLLIHTFSFFMYLSDIRVFLLHSGYIYPLPKISISRTNA